jgi:hypothetical protein
MREAAPHYNAKMRMYNLIQSIKPDLVGTEYVHKNPFNRTGDPKYDYKFDVYFELDNRKVAIEIDDKVGHTSKRSSEKRYFKKTFLKSVGIELYAFPRKWVVGRKAFNDAVFLEELRLKGREKLWYYN